MTKKRNTGRVLPDGSAFVVASAPLPADHWLYAPPVGEPGGPKDPAPVLTNAHRAAVIEAARYAIRGATMRGQEKDFDPDALVQNLCYALCGPAYCVDRQRAAPYRRDTSPL